MPLTGDNVVSDPIVDGLFDQAIRLRAFIKVADFSGWATTDQIHVLGLKTGDPTASIADVPGVYIRGNGLLYGTHGATGGTPLVAGTEYCVETSIVVSGADGSIDQEVWVDGISVGFAIGADPDPARDPPSEAVAGVSASLNTRIKIVLRDPVWNIAPIGCGDSNSQSSTVLYPGDAGYPFLPSDPFYGEPYWPPDTMPLYPGDAGYPYTPDDGRYGDRYYPPPTSDVGSSGTVAVHITKPTEGTLVSDATLLVEIETLEISSAGGSPLVEVWLDSHKLGDAFGTPFVFFWEWFGTKPGTHQLRAVAKTLSGARVFSAPVTIHVPDITQPDIAFLAPPPAATVSGVIEVAVAADDDVDVESVSFFVRAGGAGAAVWEWNGSDTVTLTMTGLVDGDVYSLRVGDPDSSPDDGIASGGSVTLTVDDVGGLGAGQLFTAQLVHGGAGSIPGGITGDIQFSAENVFENGVASAGGGEAETWAYDGVDLFEATFVAQAGVTYTLYAYTWTDNASATGGPYTAGTTHTLSVSLTPAAGEPVVGLLINDTTGDPFANRLFVEGVAGEGAPGNPTGATGGPEQALGTVTRPPYRVTLDTADLDPGSYTLRAVAFDPSGNAAEATESFIVGAPTLPPWSYPTMDALPPRLSVEIDFDNDPFASMLSAVILGSQPWSYLPLADGDPETTPIAEDVTGNLHAGRLFGSWLSAVSGGYRTSALRTSGIIIPAPSRRPVFTFGLFVRPHSFGTEFPMRLLDTGGLRLNLMKDGSLVVDGALVSRPGLVQAGILTPKHVALVFDGDTSTVGSATIPLPPGPASSMSLLVDGEVVAQKAPLTIADTLLMSRSTEVEWTVGGGAGDVTVDEITLWMRALPAGELQTILSARGNPEQPAPSWTDVTAYARRIDTLIGKVGEETEHGDVGTMIITFDNPLGRFEPENTGSPYYPGVTANRRIRVRAYRDAEWKPIWRGYTTDWPQEWGERRASTTVSCVGNLTRIGRIGDLSGDFAAELTGARMNRILDAAGVPASERDVDPGKLALVAQRVDRNDARSYADQAVDSELGILAEDAQGRIVFHDRDHRVTDPRSVLPRFVVGDGGPASGELPFVQADPVWDEAKVVNAIAVEWPNGTTQEAVDGASVRQHGRQGATVQTLLGSELSAARLARSILDLLGEPRWRFPAVVFSPKRLDALWDLVLDTEISDRWTMRRRRPGDASLLERGVYVESIAHSIEVGREGAAIAWQTTYTLTTVGRAAPVVLTPTVTVVAPAARATARRSVPTIVKVSNPTVRPPAALAIASPYVLGQPTTHAEVRVIAPAAGATAS